MEKTQWWLRLVGVLYLLFGTMNVVSGLGIAAHPETLTWIVLGVLMLYYSREPVRAGILVVTVALLELIVWIPGTAALVLGGMSTTFGIIFILLHFIIGATGIVFLRSHP
jgi:hypothetical protein